MLCNTISISLLDEREGALNTPNCGLPSVWTVERVHSLTLVHTTMLCVFSNIISVYFCISTAIVKSRPSRRRSACHSTESL